MYVDIEAQARANMVDGQLKPNKVTNPALLDAFRTVPREHFVPEHLRGSAYIDEDLPLGNGRYLMEPMVLARLAQTVDWKPSFSVLEVGAATAYGAAILGRIVRNVVALESDAGLAKAGRAALAELDLRNVSVVEGPLEAGYAQRAPYDVIIFGGAVAEIPQGIIDQLSSSGLMLAVLRGPDSYMGQAVLMEPVAGVLSKRVLFDAGTPRLPGFAPAPAFSF